ncbi:MAG TPA: NAD(P)H-hydrate epimerase, partial [Phycisphaerae bacterium]|nr:NAD(P)H-hydrate epimerase [Phycisphaerae bacterium]
ETAGVPGAVVMENAGRNAADAIEEFLGGAAGRRIAIVAGAGNNGGDGFVVARHLAIRGARPTTFLLAEAQDLSPDAQVNFHVIRRLRHDIRHVGTDDLANLGESLRQYDLIVDAVGGTGIRGALRGKLAQAVEQINKAGRRVVAIDIPTGLDCDTGEAAGPAVRAAMTVTFVARKKGFDAAGAKEYTGEVRVVDIGIPAELIAEMEAEAP